MPPATPAPQTDATPAAEILMIEGGQPLHGEITIGGAKNSVLKLMAAALLVDAPVTLKNVPNISDVWVMAEVIRHLGVDVTNPADNQMRIDAHNVTETSATNEYVTQMRASFNVLAPLLARYGKAQVSLPGGCSIGKRGVDLHIKGLEALGATVDVTHGVVTASADKLIGADIVFDVPSVGATENVMVAAVTAEGKTTISNAAQEPEITDLANFLNAMGADIHGAGTHEITIFGVPRTQLTGLSYEVVPDRIEAATYVIAAVATGGDVTINRVRPQHFQAVLSKLVEMGANITTPTPTSIRIQPAKTTLTAQNITTLPYPGIPTDLQAPLMALLCTATGSSMVKETIYENRFNHVGHLRRMGASIEQDGNTAVVTGIERLSGATVSATDLRAAAALVIAGLAADGATFIRQLHHMDRGYDGLEAKLRSLGANIHRLREDALPKGVTL